MKYRCFVMFFCIILVCCVFWAGCDTGGGNTNSDNPGGDRGALVCFGDSLTAGANASVIGQDDKSKSYPAYLQNKVNITVVNAGVTGDKTADGLKRIQKDVINKNPAIVIIELGANDIFNGIDIAATKNNLDSIITLIKNTKAKIYLAKFYSDSIKTIWGFELTSDTKKNYDTMYTDLKNKHNIDLIEDIWAGVWGTSNMSADGIHPKASGYQIMADNYFNALRPYLQANNMIK